jgi:glutamine synthetase
MFQNVFCKSAFNGGGKALSAFALFSQLAFSTILLGQENSSAQKNQSVIANSDVTFVHVVFMGPDGYPHTISIPKENFKAGKVHTEAFDSSSIPGLGSTQKADMKAKTDPATEVVLPEIEVNDSVTAFKMADSTDAYALCNIYENGEAPSPKCSRSALQAKMAALKAKHDATFIVGVELEYFLFDNANKGQDIAVDNAGYMAQNNNPKVALFKKALAVILKKLGLGYNKMHTEVANSQEEIVLAHGPADVIADRLVLLKMIVKKLAPQFGFRVSFDPKPKKDENGSGMHIHFSLENSKGKNLCAEAKSLEESKINPYSELCAQFMSGILKYGPVFAAFFNPTPNSYIRTGDPEKEAPNISEMGVNNRSCALRIPMIGVSGVDYKDYETRAEFRYPDPSMNPYHAFLGLLSMGMKGVEEKLAPSKIVDGINLFDFVKEGPEGIQKLRKLGFKMGRFPASLEDATMMLKSFQDKVESDSDPEITEVLPSSIVRAHLNYLMRQAAHGKDGEFEQKTFNYNY